MSNRVTAGSCSSARTTAGAIVTSGAAWRSSRSQAAGSGSTFRARNSGGSWADAAETRPARAAEAARTPTVAQRRRFDGRAAGGGRWDVVRVFMMIA